jgi:hypothetical protein
MMTARTSSISKRPHSKQAVETHHKEPARFKSRAEAKNLQDREMLQLPLNVPEVEESGRWNGIEF